jgi:hypothetical protein
MADAIQQQRLLSASTTSFGVKVSAAGARLDIRLKAIIRDVCPERSAELIEVEVMPDHVRLLVDVDPQLTDAEISSRTR